MVPAKTIGILQPMYLPWLGYFEQMARVDHFVFMDDVQYTRHDCLNRNRIKTAHGTLWLTVPVRKHRRSALINEVAIDYSKNWIRRHLRSIELNYRGRPGFEFLFGELARELEIAPEMLAELNCRLVRLLCRHLDIATPTAFSSEVPRAATDTNGRILDICRHFGADRLYDGARAQRFIDLERFAAAGIDVIFQDYRHPEYPQRHGAFVSHLSVVDLILNTGEQAPAILRSSPAAPEGAFDRHPSRVEP